MCEQNTLILVRSVLAFFSVEALNIFETNALVNIRLHSVN